MRTLIIDNYDSFTWNLAQLLAQINGEAPLVVRNDDYPWEELQALGPFDNIVISPGPGHVHNEVDVQVSRQVIAQAQVPVLGVCLGHQCMAYEFGARIERAPEPMHGRLTPVLHQGDALFKDLPPSFQAVRYHSHIVALPLPDELQAIAFSPDGLLMALRHRERPLWGVQFHPESILTEGGIQLLRNFHDLTRAQAKTQHIRPMRVSKPVSKPEPTHQVPTYQVLWQEVSTVLNSEDLFVGLFGTASEAFWLDSALLAEDRSRFSFMGEATEAARACHVQPGDASCFDRAQQLFETLDQAIAARTVGGEALPFEFRGGKVGYFGYELKALCGGKAAHTNRYADATWMQAQRFVAFDHHEQRVYLVALAHLDQPLHQNAAQQWLTDTAARIRALNLAAPVRSLNQLLPPLQHDFSRNEYLACIDQCKQALLDGESYEICLTQQLSVACEVDGLALYRTLRRINPAPFAAYLRVADIEILSASPERFLRVDASGHVETHPIKGTTRRAADPAQDQALAQALRDSEKNRAENLMIVDLLRNDLGRVAEWGSVQVPRLMYVESYATVHQLVSTVTAQLRANASLLDLVRATFPGGSVTGAPKLRTMQWIDALERSARGVYCGSIGYLGYDRVMDLNIAIRTLVVEPGRVSLGAGGAITQLSNAADEFEEMQLKTQALLQALRAYVQGDSPSER